MPEAVLASLRAKGHSVTVRDGNLVVTPKLSPEDRDAVVAVKAELLAILTRDVAAPEPKPPVRTLPVMTKLLPSKPPARDHLRWPEGPNWPDTAWLDAVTPANLPPTPFRLAGHVMVHDAEKFLAALKRDVYAGPNGPRATYGAIQAELAALKGLCR